MKDFLSAESSQASNHNSVRASERMAFEDYIISWTGLLLDKRLSYVCLVPGEASWREQTIYGALLTLLMRIYSALSVAERLIRTFSRLYSIFALSAWSRLAASDLKP